MRSNKQWFLMPLLGLSGLVILTIATSAGAQPPPPLANKHLHRTSHSVGAQDARHRQHHYRYQDPLRWGIGWGSRWGVNPRWGSSIGIGWRSGHLWPYGSGWRDDYRHRYSGFYPYKNQLNTNYRSQPVALVAPAVIAPPQRTTTHIEYASGLSHLPENAKVIQRANGTVYEWQGIEYYFNWKTQTYEVAKADTP